jgi:hypothetical protein
VSEGDSVLRVDAPEDRQGAGVTVRSLAWLSLLAALPGLVSGILLFLYYLSNFGIDWLFNALQGRPLDRAMFVGLLLAAFACVLGGALTLRGRRKGELVPAARWAFFLGLAGLLAPLIGVAMLVVAFVFWP